jgi:ABC-type lipoprotein export system ATPase subunit/YHS domain-containing protein
MKVSTEKKNKQPAQEPGNNEMLDVVCGMDLSEDDSIVEESYNGKIFKFCGEHCSERFKDNPEKYQKTPILRLEDLWKTFDMGGAKMHILQGMSINIWDGDFVAIVGASGSGKSTTLNMLGLLDKPTSGKVLLGGREVSSVVDEEKARLRSETFGFVFQQYNLIPWLTAYENIVLPRMFAAKTIDDKEVAARIEQVGLAGRVLHRPFELSGGEQQRVALLRALMNNPRIILADEPTGNLDSITGQNILTMLIDFNKKQKKTLVIVTHDSAIAKQADLIITMKDGKVVCDHYNHMKYYA